MLDWFRRCGFRPAPRPPTPRAPPPRVPGPGGPRAPPPPLSSDPCLGELVKAVRGQEAAIGDPPGRQLDARDLADVVEPRGSDETERHARSLRTCVNTAGVG